MCFQWGLECEGGPNITGTSITGAALFYASTSGLCSGALGLSKSSAYRNDGKGMYSDVATVSLSASRSDSMYGSSSHVQPASLRLAHCIKF